MPESVNLEKNSGTTKKPKTDPQHIEPINAEAPAAFLEVPLVSLKGSQVKLAIRTQNKMQLVNTAEDQLVVPAGTMLAGFGKGKWQLKSGDIDSDKQLLYKLGGRGECEEANPPRL